MAQVLRHLDDASLTVVGCACAALGNLVADPNAWRMLCLALSPLLRDVATPPLVYSLRLLKIVIVGVRVTTLTRFV
jgi:hypothetical protein